MIDAPTNCWTLAEQAIADAVSNSAAFQGVTGTNTATAAACFVFGEQKDEPLNGEVFSKEELENIRHYAQVYSDDEAPYGKQLGGTLRYLPFGSAIVFVERLVKEADRNMTDAPEQTHRWFKNHIGDLVDQIISWMEENGGPFIRTITVTDGPGLNPDDRWEANGMWQGIELTIAWGEVED